MVLYVQQWRAISQYFELYKKIIIIKKKKIRFQINSEFYVVFIFYGEIFICALQENFGKINIVWLSSYLSIYLSICDSLSLSLSISLSLTLS